MCAAPRRLVTFAYNSQCQADHDKWPHSAPSLYPLLLLGSHAQKLGCFALALWLSGLAPPLTVPSFCLPEGSPATEGTWKSQPPGGFALSPRSAFKAQEHSVPNQRPLQSCLTSPLFHLKLFPPKEAVEDKRAPGFEGVKSTFLLQRLIRLSFSVTSARTHTHRHHLRKSG